MMETKSVFEMSADLNKSTQLSARVDVNVHSTGDSQINWAVNVNHRVSPHGGGIKIMAVWKATACSSVVRYRSCLGFPENGGSRFLRNVGPYLPNVSALFATNSVSEPQIVINTVLILKHRCAFARKICKLSC